MSIQGSGLALEQVLRQLLSARLKPHLISFIRLSNAAARWHCVKRIDLTAIASNEAWGLTSKQLLEEEPVNKEELLCPSMQILLEKMNGVFRAFMDAIASLSLVAPDFIDQSLLPARQELQQMHTPHLALLFAFIKLYQRMQEALNMKTRQHLDFFYKEVLRIQPRGAEPDKVHIVFELQKILRNELQKSLIKKGELLKDGKDENKQEILFTLDDEIIVNEAQVVDRRTLFLNNKIIQKTVYLEGTYIAPDAAKSDGVKETFKDKEPKNWYTLGNKLSKFTLPGHNAPEEYPHARMGFLLASPVLLLNEGDRTVDLNMKCRLDDPACATGLPYFPAANFIANLNKLNKLLGRRFYYVSEKLVADAVKGGLNSTLADKLLRKLLKRRLSKSFTVRSELDWNIIFNNAEREVLKKFFQPIRVFRVLLSGEKEWIAPDFIEKMEVNGYNTVTKNFNFNISFKLNAGSPAITFFDKDKLKEDFNTTLPLVKIELEENIRLGVFLNPADPDCCLQKKEPLTIQPVSLYHFFRNVIILRDSTIDVAVCGVKNLIVQNDENLMDVNASVYPFGTRPDVADFDIINTTRTYAITPEFINDLNPLRLEVKQKLELLIAGTGHFLIGKTDQDIDTFLNDFVPVLAADEKIKLKEKLLQQRKGYRFREGPNFYIGSQEVFCKNWKKVDIKLKWKDKPVDFNEYYKGYRKITVGGEDVFGLDEDEFEYRLSYLSNGDWDKEDLNRKLFQHKIGALPRSPICLSSDDYEQIIMLNPPGGQRFTIENTAFNRYDISSRNGFIKLNLRNQDFCHKDYPFVLARQMMAFGKLPSLQQVEGAVYYGPNGPFVFDTNSIKTELSNAQSLADIIDGDVNATGINHLAGNVSDPIDIVEADQIRDILREQDLIDPDPAKNQLAFLSDTSPKNKGHARNLKEKITAIVGTINNVDKTQPIIPNEPWTPVISAISINYTATAAIADMDLVHLHPYPGTYNSQLIEQEPTLFPVFCDEGSLFLGIKDLVPGSNLNILFQLAEATADSEAEKEPVSWQYLDTNVWKDLRPGFEILEDASEGLTTSGIIKFSMPPNITIGNTIMPKDLYWIKASVVMNSKTVSETIDIHTQAISATFTNTSLNDKKRLSKPLASQSIAKLNTADANIKKVNQFYETFGGKTNEADGHYYVRVSELLRHKGRAIQKWDYERLALEKFPDLYKVKCITHSFKTDSAVYTNDIPYAPGYVILAVIPDLTKLNAGNSFEPKAPVSLLANLEEYFKKITSPFVRLKAANPRYEKVHFKLVVQLLPGKDKTYYEQRLKDDLKEHLAPWSVGEFSKLSFGQPVSRSSIIGLLESGGYVDFIRLFEMGHENNIMSNSTENVYPVTPRSILIAGEVSVQIVENPGDWCTQADTCSEIVNISGVRKYV